jgi:hypothetical protein
MTIYTDIKRSAGAGFGKSQEWFRSQFMSRVSGHYTENPKPKQMLFFSYSAKTSEKLQYWDKYPLVYVMDIGETYFVGGNLHYIAPQFRSSIGKMFQSGTADFPDKMFHKYLKSNVQSPLYIIDEEEWADVGLLPIEQFVTYDRGKLRKIPSLTVWDND